LGILVTTEVITEDPIVRLQLESRPQTLTLVRGMLSGVAEPLAIDPELLDDLKTAVSEACNNVVLHAYGGEPGPMRVMLYVDADRIRVTVEDEGLGFPVAALAADRSPGIGVSVIRALTRDARFTARPGGGTQVRMDFAIQREGRELLLRPASAGPDDVWGPAEAGEVVVSLSPVTLLTGVLGRLARTLAATAHFSLDRFSDVYLITDTLAGLAAGAAAGLRIGARLVAQDRRLELAVGPFRSGTGELLSASPAGRVSSPLALLSDQVSVEPAVDGELVRVVVIDHRR
jgi:serine/threonine-protein kinase RsbW